MIFNDRVSKVKQELSNNKLDGLYITNLTNIKYLTGFTGSAGSLLILENEQHFLLMEDILNSARTRLKIVK